VLPEIDEGDASGDVAVLYEDVRATLRSTFVPRVMRALAVHPGYALAAWRALRGNLQTVDAEQLAGRLRVLCVDRLKSIASVPRPVVGIADELRAEIRPVLEALFYVVPKALIAVTALREAWEGRAITGRSGSPVRTIPRGAPPSMPPIPRVAAGAGAAGSGLERILGHWPEYWRAIADSLTDARTLAAYRAAAPGLVAAVAQGCHELPLAFSLDRATAARTLSADAVDAVEAILATCQTTTPETLWHVARLLRDLPPPARGATRRAPAPSWDGGPPRGGAPRR
jgi:hypothetical protein